MKIFVVTYANTNDSLYAASCAHTSRTEAENDIRGCACSIIADEHLDTTAEDFMKEHSTELSDGSVELTYCGEYEYYAQLMVTEI